ncbi:MAG: 4-hydroxythreonine-4-phosphate dehydrogenase PdxA [Elusimicrobia bacterium]|nr:4-hydroxythreonine-4-phosphate dehydrogenase PdxA [Elusimicrobiota bacterium]
MALKPFLAFTTGDPAGVGPWVGTAAARDARVRRLCRPLLVGDAWVLHRFLIHRSLRIHPITDLAEYLNHPDIINVLHVPHPGIRTLRLGFPQKVGGEAACLAVRTAAGLALQKRVAGVVTGPISKESLKMAGVPFPGHTEMLARLSRASHVEMLMAAGPLRSVLVTRHIPLKKVPGRLTKNNIVSAVRWIDPWLKKVLGLKGKPRWAVCGLNPHAGDRGLLGREEIGVVAPAVKALRTQGLSADGPLPADVAWAKHVQGEYDAVASLYHDQGMIPLKTLYPRGVVNITVGLPWVRTSPGHGTAFDLASGRKPYSGADPSATIDAALWAMKITRHG